LSEEIAVELRVVVVPRNSGELIAAAANTTENTFPVVALQTV
jgi:hypothetical protein